MPLEAYQRRCSLRHLAFSTRSVMTCMPSCTASPLTSVLVPSLAPVRIAYAHRRAVAQDPDLLLAIARAVVGGPRHARRRPRDQAARPRRRLGCAAGIPAGGAKRSAAFGTSSTSRACCVVISAVAVMPGRRLRSSLFTVSTVL